MVTDFMLDHVIVECRRTIAFMYEKERERERRGSRRGSHIPTSRACPQCLNFLPLSPTS
jgi:hypothetical protein